MGQVDGGCGALGGGRRGDLAEKDAYACARHGRLGQRLAREEQRAEAEFGDKSRWRDLTTNLPAGRAAKPEEVANLVTFLASERAAYTTGVIYSIDGGVAARHGL